jgi:hypothetical protein
MNTQDAAAIDSLRAALKAAVIALEPAYKLCEDARIESLIVNLTDHLEESLGDLENIADQIHDDAPLRPWFRRYAAA